jgi:hypothetical protein
MLLHAMAHTGLSASNMTLTARSSRGVIISHPNGLSFVKLSQRLVEESFTKIGGFYE